MWGNSTAYEWPLAQRTEPALELIAGHQEERQANAEWKRAVAAREEAQQQLVELYKARAEGVRRGEPQRHWLH